MRKTKALTQLYAMQEVLETSVLAPTTPPKEQAQCACAWERLEERKRILRRIPLPGSLRPNPEKKRGHRERSYRQSHYAGPVRDYHATPAEVPGVAAPNA
jgi:hypothetical protein